MTGQTTGGGGSSGAGNIFGSQGGAFSGTNDPNAYDYSGGQPDYTWGNTQPATDVGTPQDPSQVAQQQAQASAPPPATTAPGGQQSGSSQPAWMDNISNLLFGSGAQKAQGAPEPIKYQAQATEPGTGQGPGWIQSKPFDPNAAPNDQATPGSPAGAAMASRPPANAPMGTSSPQPPAPFPTEASAEGAPPGWNATVSPQSSQNSGGNTATSPAAAPAAAPAATPPASNYPDIAGSAREAGAGPPATSTATGTATPSAATSAPNFSGPNLPQALGDLLSLNFGRFIGDLLGQQGMPAGSNYAGTSQPPASPPTASASQPPAAPPAQPSPFTTAGLPPGTSGQPSVTSPEQPATATAPEQPVTTAAQPTSQAPGAAAAALPPPGTAIGNRRADEGHPEFPGPSSSGQNWYGTRPPDYFQRHGGRVGADLTTVSTPFGQVTANKQVANDFVGLTNDLRAAGVPGIEKFGSFNPRQKRYGSGYSSHAYGAAFDINDAAGRMNPQTQNWINQHPQQWQDMLRRHNFAQYMPKGDPNHLEWVGPGAGGNTSVAAAQGPRWANALAGPGGTVSAGPTRGDINKNPGNIKMGPDARQYGATGVDNQGHAIFPTQEAGIQAQASLLRRNYNNKTVPEMGRAYASDRGWAKGVMKAGGFGPNDRLDLNNPDTMNRLQRAIWKQEGTHVPTAQPPGSAAATAASKTSTEGTPLWQPTGAEGPHGSATTYQDELVKRGQKNVGHQLGYVAKRNLLQQILTPTSVGQNFAPPSLAAQAGYGDIDRVQ